MGEQTCQIPEPIDSNGLPSGSVIYYETNPPPNLKSVSGSSPLIKQMNQKFATSLYHAYNVFMLIATILNGLLCAVFLFFVSNIILTLTTFFLLLVQTAGFLLFKMFHQKHRIYVIYHSCVMAGIGALTCIIVLGVSIAEVCIHLSSDEEKTECIFFCMYIVKDSGLYCYGLFPTLLLGILQFCHWIFGVLIFYSTKVEMKDNINIQYKSCLKNHTFWRLISICSLGVYHLCYFALILNQGIYIHHLKHSADWMKFHSHFKISLYVSGFCSLISPIITLFQVLAKFLSMKMHKFILLICVNAWVFSNGLGWVSSLLCMLNVDSEMLPRLLVSYFVPQIMVNATLLMVIIVSIRLAAGMWKLHSIKLAMKPPTIFVVKPEPNGMKLPSIIVTKPAADIEVKSADDTYYALDIYPTSAKIEPQIALAENQMALAESQTIISNNQMALSENQMALSENQMAITETQTAFAENPTEIQQPVYTI